ncbi:hypothetical protein [Caldibacillus debilis]|uniref:Uncharacterized protein n=1 Tax=Caldibacillus debilis GB1 TaxID=1339248 RepID=A0A420VDL8_9BACI|nr:hypothetical protein [Caldibacillus debilis]RKO61777.1 hypothetical protein Cdeb_01270 [Caldibacillus debilis GB1]
MKQYVIEYELTIAKKAYVKAESPEQAKQLFDNGEYKSIDSDDLYQGIKMKSIKEVNGITKKKGLN